MPYLKSWEEFEKVAERVYLQDPKKVSFRGVNVEGAFTFLSILPRYPFTEGGTAGCFIRI
jgi:hypothetical protein